MKFIEFYGLILSLKFIRMFIFGCEKEIQRTLNTTIMVIIIDLLIAILAYYLLEPIVPKVIKFLR